MRKAKQCRLKKEVSDGICVSYARLRFVLTKLIVPTLAEIKTWHSKRQCPHKACSNKHQNNWWDF